MERQVPEYEYKEYFSKRNEYCLLIPTWNEGERIKIELNRLKNKDIPKQIDIFILDAGSTDGSINDNFLKEIGVRAVLTIRMKGQANAYKAGFSKVSNEKYKGIVTVDGNNKNNVEQTMEFVELLEKGYDFVQGSRFMKGGHHENTPILRLLGMKLFSNPLISMSSGFKYTEIMSSFRGYKMDIIDDEKINVFRDIFQTWDLLLYLSNRIPQLGYKVIEIPQIRVYPKKGKTPTKINVIGNIRIIIQLIKIALGIYNYK
ncbi:glycosyltransferase family 2 protein [Brachyspira hampsonii]|uniref:Glycosyl transferase family 2 n=1 Tax=Brachyspira hampsonii TaxID=1287055 RepID=A0AAC9TUD1_9SPIR|nr:glycosyltransferase family 2 protein [Brachyspira hampsonii]ASJ21382.1 glycosyl transferase family 2 [Brachyspira hampsonii]ELV06363.1 dolichyl-phosphate beta-D-mannosyltransferase [Brachyspira hampsonii 30599]MBW5379692.1 glycosyltransferase family 2 protein [Brachyspira hampsonii]OEJ13120.1 glycosyl transferase family 2 [Brachyspira hampsonii]